MTEAEKINAVRAFAGVDSTEYPDTTVQVFLNIAESKALSRLYPYTRPTDATLPSKYEIIVCELASRILLKQGAGGEKAHNENGVNRTYGSVNEEDLLSEITPYCEVF